jgi:hypothetical protein
MGTFGHKFILYFKINAHCSCNDLYDIPPAEPVCSLL